MGGRSSAVEGCVQCVNDFGVGCAQGPSGGDEDVGFGAQSTLALLCGFDRPVRAHHGAVPAAALDPAIVVQFAVGPRDGAGGDAEVGCQLPYRGESGARFKGAAADEPAICTLSCS